ncbi:hypothetical protein DPMN_024677 [Dreissena polymorpha]|uniref:Uncharacterized protein n=1 Tax=Dreissena polymorpha TaxID=45954 RepID=A0A9D4LND5_DREPO|nr:hypothetical protein DPMN_024677 [Dreissena polymorpha]
MWPVGYALRRDNYRSVVISGPCSGRDNTVAAQDKCPESLGFWRILLAVECLLSLPRSIKVAVNC